MKIKTLKSTSVAAITNAFNSAFSDYVMPIHMSESAMRRKIRVDQIDLSLSPGCFIDDQLCGFILHGIGRRGSRRVAWNGGTGVTPNERGHGITTRLFEFIVPELQKKGCTEAVLEAIDSNEEAIHVYQRNGFKTTRELACYGGNVLLRDVPFNIDLRTITGVESERFHSFWSWQPSFQSAEHKLRHLRNEVQIVGSFKGGTLVGYIAFEKSETLGDIYQFAVDKKFRRRGVGSAMFSRAAAGKTVPLKVINVDARHGESTKFLEKIGLQQTVRQIEMVKVF